jgi:hypothetical protein
VKKPKTLHIAEMAYNAYYDERPQVFFDDLNHEAHMRWVRIVRAVLGEDKKIPKGGNTTNHRRISDEERRERDRARKQRERDAVLAARANGQDHDDESVHVVVGKAKKGKRRKVPGSGIKAGHTFKTVEEKAAEWERGDEHDKKLLTDRKSRDRRGEEVKARARMSWRNGQRRKLGLPVDEEIAR